MLPRFAACFCCVVSALPAGSLSTRGSRFPGVQLRPLQFLLMDRMQVAVTGVTGSKGCLYSRANLDVPVALAMPEPSLQLLAGLLRLHHPDSYPDGLLRAVCTKGRYLDTYLQRPCTPLEELQTRALQRNILPHGSNFQTISMVLTANGSIISAEISFTAENWHLVATGTLEESPTENNVLQLVEPQLITMYQIHKATQGRQDMQACEAALRMAEGFVLQIVLRKDLRSSLIERLDLQVESWRCMAARVCHSISRRGCWCFLANCPHQLLC